MRTMNKSQPPPAAPAGRVRDLGTAVAQRAHDVSGEVLDLWRARCPASASTSDPRVVGDIVRTTELATLTVTEYLEHGRLPSERRSGEVAATGKAPLHDTISLADLTKLYLFWRDVMLHTVREEAARLILEPSEIEQIEEIVHAGSDGSIVRMAKQFDVERERLQRDLAIEQSRLVHHAFHDPLTGLPNRRLFFDRLNHALAIVQRRDSGVALLFIDVDDFKSVNDRLGHRSGDELLAIVAERLLKEVRQGDTVTRFAGDEFTVLLENLDDGGLDAHEVAARIEHAAFVAPFAVGNVALAVSAEHRVSRVQRRRPSRRSDPTRRCGDVPSRRALALVSCGRRSSDVVVEVRLKQAAGDRFTPSQPPTAALKTFLAVVMPVIALGQPA